MDKQKKKKNKNQSKSLDDLRIIEWEYLDSDDDLRHKFP